VKPVAASVVALALSSCGNDAASTPTDPSSPTAPSVARTSWSDATATITGPIADALVQAELERNAAAPVIVEALAHAEPQVRAAGLRALTRIDPPSAPVAVVSLLERETPTAAMLAAVALLDSPPGPPGEAVEPSGPWRVLEDHLWTRYAVVEDAGEAQASLFALARLGGARTQALLAIEAADATEDTHRRATFEAMGILCARRHPLVAAALPAIADGLAAGVDVQRAAAFALARCAAPSAEHFAGDERRAWVDRLAPLVAGDDETARLIWKAYEALGEAPAELPQGLLGDAPPPWWVEVEAVRALAGTAEARARLVERLLVVPLERWTGARAHVLLVALASLRRAVDTTPELAQSLAPLFERIEAAQPTDARARKILALARCEARGLQAIADGDIAPVERCAGPDDGLPVDHASAFAVDIVVQMRRTLSGSARADALLQRAADPRPAVAAPALAALADVDDPRVAAALREALGRDDAGVLAAAAGAVAARAVDRQKRDRAAVPHLVDLLARTDEIAALEARLAAIEALGSLARDDEGGPAITPGTKPPPATSIQPAEARAWLQRAVLPLATDRHAAIRRAAWAALASAPDLQSTFASRVPTSFPSTFPEAAKALADARARPATGLRLHTDAGVFVIELDAPAPITQANLVALARAQRFDGLRFHRVVPGFVAQGGDPRGDGYGGPGWLMPCEWSDRIYERGTVGIALAGKDTGGSQFFIAHTRQPHLDGRYTVVGRVIDGMDVVDALLPHDLIERVEAIEGTPR